MREPASWNSNPYFWERISPTVVFPINDINLKEQTLNSTTTHHPHQHNNDHSTRLKKTKKFAPCGIWTHARLPWEELSLNCSSSKLSLESSALDRSAKGAYWDIDPTSTLKNLPVTQLEETGKESKMGTRLISRDEVAKHNKLDDQWLIVHDKVYDITKFSKYHPGGAVISYYRGIWNSLSIGFHL